MSVGIYNMPLSSTLRANVNTILNPDYENSSVGYDKNLEIDRRPTYAYYDIQCTFYGYNLDTEEPFEFKPLEIKAVDIIQTFLTNYSDDIGITIALTPVQYLMLYDNSRGLKCVLKLRHRDKDSSYISDIEPIEKEYLVLFKDKTDIRKRIGKTALVPEDRKSYTIEHSDQYFDNVELQLIDKQVYNLRHMKINFQLANATIKDAIFYVAKLCGIEQISLVEPDNIEILENFIVPPIMSFEECMSFFQTYYGVYNKGLNFYFTNGTLYIHPTYETEPETPMVKHLYYVGSNFHDMEISYAYSKEDTHIVINNGCTIMELQDTGVETLGNAIFVLHSDRVIDRTVSMGEAKNASDASIGLGALSVQPVNTALLINKEDDAGATFKAYNPTYMQDRSNVYAVKSRLSAFRRSIAVMSWTNALPFTFEPGYKVVYHYDGEDSTRRIQQETIAYSSEYQTKNAVCCGVKYTLEAGARIGNTLCYRCMAYIELAMDKEPVMKEPEAFDESTVAAATANKEATSNGTADVGKLAEGSGNSSAAPHAKTDNKPGIF